MSAFYNSLDFALSVEVEGKLSQNRSALRKDLAQGLLKPKC